MLNFSDKHDTYYYAYKYVCKSDKDVLLSQNHPNLDAGGSPSTKSCVKAYRQSRKKMQLLHKTQLMARTIIVNLTKSDGFLIWKLASSYWNITSNAKQNFLLLQISKRKKGKKT